MKRLLILAFLCLVFLVPVTLTSCFPESAVRQKKIDRERRHNENQARKSYEMDLKRHHKSQSKRTRSMMKDTRRKSKKVTPGRK
ncbi:MAG: hypothetical protein IH596_03315 [Bacteroidales bacterium]|nr:hypothetical protein [Bacteroidales bacterium]